MHIAVRVCFLSERCDRLYVRQAPMSQKSLKNWPSAPTTQFFCQELGIRSFNFAYSSEVSAMLLLLLTLTASFPIMLPPQCLQLANLFHYLTLHCSVAQLSHSSALPLLQAYSVEYELACL